MSPSWLLQTGGQARRFNAVAGLSSGRYGLFDSSPVSLTFLTYAERVPLTFLLTPNPSQPNTYLTPACEHVQHTSEAALSRQ